MDVSTIKRKFEIKHFIPVLPRTRSAFKINRGGVNKGSFSKGTRESVVGNRTAAKLSHGFNRLTFPRLYFDFCAGFNVKTRLVSKRVKHI